MSETPNDSDRVSTAVLAERLRMYMQVSAKWQDTVGGELHEVAVGIKGLDTRHDRLSERLGHVEDDMKDVKDDVKEVREQVSKKVPVIWLRGTWAAIAGLIALIGGILGLIVLLQRTGILH